MTPTRKQILAFVVFVLIIAVLVIWGAYLIVQEKRDERGAAGGTGPRPCKLLDKNGHYLCATMDDIATIDSAGRTVRDGKLTPPPCVQGAPLAPGESCSVKVDIPMERKP